MSDFDFPADLVDLQRRFYELDERCETLASSHPRAVDVVAGMAEISEEQHAELARARAERLTVSEQMQAHEWWAGVDGLAAKASLRNAAQRAMSDTPSK